MADTRYLEQNGGKWRVVIAVPRPLQAKLGTKLKQSLNTDSLTTANALKWNVIRQLKAKLEQATSGTLQDPVVQEGLLYREALEKAKDDHERENIEAALDARIEVIRGTPLGPDPDDPSTPLYDEARDARASLLNDVALGMGTPLLTHLKTYHSQGNRKARTQADDERAIEYLTDWCRQENLAPTIEEITRKRAGQFINGYLTGDQKGQAIARKTANKYISSLSGYWKWLEKRGFVDANVWQGQSLPKEVKPTEEMARAFTDEEMVKLLTGDAKPYLAAMIRIAALTGARIGAIAELRVKDVAGGMITFQPQKREKGTRTIPMHPDLVATFKQLSEGKQQADWLFPELSVPPKGSQLERSMPAVKLFGRYREDLGVRDRVEGAKRDRITFHSFRRWFITKAEQAYIEPHVIETVVGHKRQGMSLGLYSGGPSIEQMRKCVNAVKLPNIKNGQVDG